MKKYNIFDAPVIGDRIKRYIISSEGGDKTSLTLRRYVLDKYKVEVGIHTYGGCFNKEFNVGGTVKIGRYCSFAQDIRYFGANHPIHSAILSPYFYNSKWGGYSVKDVERNQLTVGNDVWVGYGTIITSSCHFIGNGSIIGAGSIVTKDVKPYSIVVGSPAKLLKMRFDEDVCSALEESNWYNLEPDEIMQYYSFLNDPLEFARQIIMSKGSRE